MYGYKLQSVCERKAVNIIALGFYIDLNQTISRRKNVFGVNSLFISNVFWSEVYCINLILNLTIFLKKKSNRGVSTLVCTSCK